MSPRLTLKCEVCGASGTKGKQTVTTGDGTSALGQDGTQNSKAQGRVHSQLLGPGGVHGICRMGSRVGSALRVLESWSPLNKPKSNTVSTKERTPASPTPDTGCSAPLSLQRNPSANHSCRHVGLAAEKVNSTGSVKTNAVQMQRCRPQKAWTKREAMLPPAATCRGPQSHSNSHGHCKSKMESDSYPTPRRTQTPTVRGKGLRALHHGSSRKESPSPTGPAGECLEDKWQLCRAAQLSAHGPMRPPFPWPSCLLPRPAVDVGPTPHSFSSTSERATRDPAHNPHRPVVRGSGRRDV